jgi:hypothetical protein
VCLVIFLLLVSFAGAYPYPFRRRLTWSQRCLRRLINFRFKDAFLVFSILVTIVVGVAFLLIHIHQRQIEADKEKQKIDLPPLLEDKDSEGTF